METNKQNTIVSSLIIFLLLIQVILSALIIKRLNDNDQTLSDIDQKLVRLAGPQQPEVLMFVEDVSVDDDPRLGTKEAPITIVEFADYECPACAQANLDMKQILSEYEEEILFVYRDFPLESIHPNAFKAAEAANCAGDQNMYWEMHDLLFVNQTALDTDSLSQYADTLGLDLTRFNDCLSNADYAEEIRHDMEDAQRYQVLSTPTFFINGQRVQGANLVALRSMIDKILENE